MRSNPLVSALAVLVLACLPLAAAEPPATFTLGDPRGDDHGDGTLVYPIGGDFRPGDLDLVEFAARPGDGGTWFTATFARDVRRPDQRAIDSLGGRLDRLAPLGFYTINIDVYVDTDGVAGSGSTTALPGRGVTIDPRTAWEKAICLTPRPDVAKDALRAMKVKAAREELKAQGAQRRHDDAVQAEAKAAAQRAVDDTVFFPERVRVTGRTISFFVPASFLPQAAASHAYAVAVSGADLVNRLDVGTLIGRPKGEDEQALMILAVGTAPRPESFGSRRDPDDLPAPLVDILVPPGRTQEDVLKDYDRDAGRLAVLTGIVPDARGPAAPATAPALPGPRS